MKLLTQDIRRKLLRNGKINAERAEDGLNPIDHHPVVKLFTPDASATWLLTELDPDDTDIAFGLCDLGFQCPELGYVRLSDIEGIRGKLGLPVERDRFFNADRSLSAYADVAQAKGRIVA